ncbi:hypothetical protein [Nonomuraea sp. NPDC049784]|uniref:hypothetical protein n=1 Tax=Nonomuraea sp. NPDC049784 TaxID=3154361 RepID=UPI0033F88BFE
MRAIISTVIVMAVAATGCMSVGTYPSQTYVPNSGANADVQGVLHLRNVFLLDGADPSSPSPQLALYAVLLNSGGKPVQLDRITVEGGGSVQLAGPVTLPPNQPVGTGDKPIGTVSGVRGATVPMTFAFSGTAPIRVNVPVQLRAGEYANLPTAPAGR